MRFKTNQKRLICSKEFKPDSYSCIQVNLQQNRLNDTQLEKMMRIHCFVLWLMYLDGYFSADLTDVENLYSTLLTNYNKDVRPLTTTDAPVYVNGTFNLVGLKEFDEVNGKFSLIGFFTFTWVDSRLSWDRSSSPFSIFLLRKTPKCFLWYQLNIRKIKRLEWPDFFFTRIPNTFKTTRLCSCHFYRP